MVGTVAQAAPLEHNASSPVVLHWRVANDILAGSHSSEVVPAFLAGVGEEDMRVRDKGHVGQQSVIEAVGEL